MDTGRTEEARRALTAALAEARDIGSPAAREKARASLLALADHLPADRLSELLPRDPRHREILDAPAGEEASEPGRRPAPHRMCPRDFLAGASCDCVSCAVRRVRRVRAEAE
jgi:hypothetical protein